MKKKIFKILSILMIFCISILCVGCMGSSPEDNESGYDDEFDEWEDEFGSGMAFDMYGAKVLYRPDSYDYNTGSGAETGETNDYYGKYAYLILSNLVRTYGYQFNNNSGLTISEDKMIYLNDSIRYNVNTVGTVTQKKTEGGSVETLASPYTIVGANLNSSWQWSYSYNLSNIESGRYNAFLYNNAEDSNSYYANGNMYYATFDDLATFTNNINSFYSSMSTFYTTAYLGTDSESDNTNYSDLVKALEYVVYSYALDLEPKNVTVNVVNNPSEANNLYTVSVQGFDSVDDALADVKDLFTTIGSYVGLIERQINKISKWIQDNVIGTVDGTLTTYDNVIENYDGEGNLIGYTFSPANSSTVEIKNYKTAVDNIVKAVCANVSIGQEADGSDVTINNRFLASEVKEYVGNTFFIEDDSNFPAPGSSLASTAIQPLEYQSVQFMLKDKVNIGDVWVALKYDADLDGTEEGVYDLNKYIDVIVELNYYNHTHNKLFTIGSQTTRVYDGPYKTIMTEENYNLPIEDHGTIFFSDFVSNCKDTSLANIAFGKQGVTVGAYNTDIGNGILKTDVGESGYSGSPLASQNPLILVGTKDVRKYYSIIEPTDEELGTNQTYITGRANPAMYAGNDGCDYLEVTYKVLKTKGDRNTNYKFYTGIVAMFDVFSE